MPCTSVSTLPSWPSCDALTASSLSWYLHPTLTQAVPVGTKGQMTGGQGEWLKETAAYFYSSVSVT